MINKKYIIIISVLFVLLGGFAYKHFVYGKISERVLLKRYSFAQLCLFEHNIKDFPDAKITDIKYHYKNRQYDVTVYVDENETATISWKFDKYRTILLGKK